ncbi:RNA polymerase sigma factor [Devosia sp.]|uniref:RNA polymerase sigma factor n=1 Tax=Devosia sp. TaxID=1871048 RepID=UPI002605C51B|nr:RNA polymerase sigma factor [Devosia sp.]
MAVGLIVDPYQAETILANEQADLVALARAGGENAIRTLIERNNQRLFRAARSVLRNDGEAEDVVQETYVKAFTALAGFRGEASFSTWVTRIALNEAVSRLRRRRKRSGLEALDAAVSADAGLVSLFPLSLVPLAADKEVARSEMRHVLETAIDGLPEGFRTVFVLRDVEGLTTEETAAQLALKPETVKTRLHRARRMLRAVLEEQMRGSFTDLYPFDGARCAKLGDRVIDRLNRS